MSPWNIETYLKACRFACERHAGQLFKGTDLPYFLHLTQVTAEVIRTLETEDGLDGDLAISCAWLHDCLEDYEFTRTTVEDLVGVGFSPSVIDGVKALTKVTSLPKEERMPDSIRRILAQPREVALVKLADRITNLQPPPATWDKAKVLSYGIEAETLLDHLGYASAYLASRLRQRLAEYRI